MDQFYVYESSVVIDAMLDYLSYDDYYKFEDDINNKKINITIKNLLLKKTYVNEMGSAILARAIKDGKVTIKSNNKIIFDNKKFIIWAEKEGWLVEVTSLTGTSKKQFVTKN